MMLDVFGFALKRTFPLLRMAIWIPCALVLGGEIVRQVNDVRNPFKAFRIYMVSVPNHCTGENPIVHVTRASDGGHVGRYASRFDNVTENRAPQCTFESPKFEYKKRDDFFFVTNFNSYFQGSNGSCSLPPGKWRGNLRWTFDRKWHSDAVVKFTTSEFEVWSKFDPRCQKQK